jgi:hypothetical protein
LVECISTYRTSASVIWLAGSFVVAAPTLTDESRKRPCEPGSKETEASCVPPEPGSAGRFACGGTGPGLAAGHPLRLPYLLEEKNIVE